MMLYKVPVEVYVLATSGADAEQRIFEMLRQAVFAWRRIYNIKEFYTHAPEEVLNS